MTDSDLLECLAAGDSSALEELIRRHGGWIYRAAQRQLRDTALADDATQAVFLVLIRKAGSLSPGIPLAAWLHRVLLVTTKEIARKEARLKQREETAAMMRQEQSSPEENAWMEMAPLLESLVYRLGKSDRQAILLRFYGQRDFVDVAAELQTTETAARKRVERAVRKLRQLFAAHNIHRSSDLLGSALSIHAGGAAGVELVARMIGPTASSATAAISNAVLRKLRWMKAGLIGSMAGVASFALIVSAVVRSAAAPNKSIAKAGDPTVVRAAALPNQPATQSVDPELDRLIAQLQIAETKIHNLHIIHFAVTQQRRFPTIPQWAPTLGQVEGSAWFDDVGGGRARYQFSKSIEEMTDGPRSTKKEWVSRSIDCGTDGRQTRYTMSSDNIIIWPQQKVTISINPSMDIYPAWDWMLTSLEFPNCPWSFASTEVAVMYTQNPAHPEILARLSQIILEGLTKGERFHVRHKTIKAIQAVGIAADELNPNDPPQVWWLDPQRDYTLVQSEDFNYRGPADPHTPWRVNVTKWKQAAPGIWFPITATCEEEFADHTDRYIYSVEDVVANDPKFNQADFLPPIHVGQQVRDHRSNPPKEYQFSADSGIPE